MGIYPQTRIYSQQITLQDQQDTINFIKHT